MLILSIIVMSVKNKLKGGDSMPSKQATSSPGKKGGNDKRNRSAETGKFTTKEYAAKHPNTTVAESRKKKSK